MNNNNHADAPVRLETTAADTPVMHAELASSNGAALVGFSQADTGAVTRTVEDRLRDAISVKDFGAVGDGLHDDTDPFQNALNTGQAVYVPQGSYKITASLTISPGGGLLGEGEKSSLVRFFTGGQMIRYPGGTQYGDPIILRDFSITTDSSIATSSGDTGIDIGYETTWGGRGLISNLLIIFQWDGFKWSGGSMNTMTNIQVLNGNGHGFYGVNARGELSSCLAQYNSGNGYFFYAQTNAEAGVQLTSTGTFGNNGWGYLFDAAPGVTGANIYMKGVSSSTDAAGGIGFVKAYIQIWMTQVLIESAGSAHVVHPAFAQVPTAIGLYMTGGCGLIVVSDLFIQTCQGSGAYFDNLSRASFTNMTVINNGLGNVGGVNAVGINLNSNNTDINFNNLIVNYGASQTTDIALSTRSNQVAMSNIVYRTMYEPGGPNSRVFNVRSTAPTTLASAAAIQLPMHSSYFAISGTTNISSITASWVGRQVTLQFAGALTVFNENNLKLVSNFAVTGNDTLSLICDGTNWSEVARSTI